MRRANSAPGGTRFPCRGLVSSRSNIWPDAALRARPGSRIFEGQTVDRIDFALSRGGVITGRITDQNGEPQAGVQMNALRFSWRRAAYATLERTSLVLLDRGRPTISDISDLRPYAGQLYRDGGHRGRIDQHARARRPRHHVPSRAANVDEAQSVEVEIGQDVPVHFALTAGFRAYQARSSIQPVGPSSGGN